MMQRAVKDWCKKGWAAEWQCRFGAEPIDAADADFFGLPSARSAVFVGVGGMHLLVRRVIAASGATIHRGVRVSAVEPVNDGRDGWILRGTSGSAAFHDTPAEAAEKAAAKTLGRFDAVLLTDISSSFGQWHRASAGIAASIGDSLQHRVRVPLFSCMIAFEEPIEQYLPWDAVTISPVTNSPLWFASRSGSRPGINLESGSAECWTLISTAEYALAQISETTMQDPVTGAFRPQTNEYLNSVPGPTLLEAFRRVVNPHLQRAGIVMPNVIYCQAQRWGSAFPAPIETGECKLSDEAAEVCGVRYTGKVPPLLYPRPAVELADFLADDQRCIYYAGDFCSHRCPGFETAALSGWDGALHMRSTLRERKVSLANTSDTS